RRATLSSCFLVLSFLSDTATPQIFTLSLHDALPIWVIEFPVVVGQGKRLFHDGAAASGFDVVATEVLESGAVYRVLRPTTFQSGDRKSTRLNSSHVKISYAVFCLKKKNNIN